MGVQQHPYQGRRQVEGCVHHPLQPLRATSHVLQTVQLSTNLPSLHGVMHSVVKVFLGSAKARQVILTERPTSFWA